MNDPEFIELSGRYVLGILVALIFCVPLFFFFKNRWAVSTTWIDKVKENEEVVFLVTENDCTNCKKIENELNDLLVEYTLINPNKVNEYEDLLKVLDISKDDIIPPTIIYVKEEKIVATLVEIDDTEELSLFVDNYQLSR